MDHEELVRLGRRLLVAIGEDPDREGLRDTPRRWAAWWRDFIGHQPGSTGTVFAAEQVDQMIVVSGLRVWSLCEHHLLPFWCDLSIGYVARDRILGLSKFARIARACASRLQVQERLTTEVADAIGRLTGSPDVAVLGRGEHLCLTMRGAREPHRMTTSALRGVFKDDAAARAEFLGLAGRAANARD